LAIIHGGTGFDHTGTKRSRKNQPRKKRRNRDHENLQGNVCGGYAGGGDHASEGNLGGGHIGRVLYGFACPGGHI